MCFWDSFRLFVWSFSGSDTPLVENVEDGMKTLFCVLSLALLCGCNGQSTLTTLIKRPSGPPPDYIEALKAEARHSHRYWIIFCAPWSDDPDRQFMAELCDRTCSDGNK